MNKFSFYLDAVRFCRLAKISEKKIKKTGWNCYEVAQPKGKK